MWYPAQGNPTSSAGGTEKGSISALALWPQALAKLPATAKGQGVVLLMLPPPRGPSCTQGVEEGTASCSGLSLMSPAGATVTLRKASLLSRVGGSGAGIQAPTAAMGAPCSICLPPGMEAEA